MILECKQLFDIVGESVLIDYTLDLSDYELFLTKPFAAPIVVRGKAVNAAGIVTLSYTVSFTLHLSCDRCLDLFDEEFNYSFEQTLVQSLSTDNDEYIVVPDCKLLLDKLVLSDILLSLPSKLLCSRDCKGLCFNCGTNLNRADCLCVKREIDPRLNALSGLLK